MWRWFRWVLLVVVVLVIAFFALVLQPWVFLPHEKIQMTLPFPPEADAYTYLIPMGEKIEHPDGMGHPGLDFGWKQKTAVLAVADGRIFSISKGSEGITITQSLGWFYSTQYKEMNEIEPNLHFFSKIKKGQLLGYSGCSDSERSKEDKEHGLSGQIHWDFSSSSMSIDRLCPLSYFDAESRQRIENIWAAVPSHDKFKIRYPDICSGDYKDKED